MPKPVNYIYVHCDVFNNQSKVFMYSGDVFHPGYRPPKGACKSTGVELFRALLGEASDRPPKAGGKILPG